MITSLQYDIKMPKYTQLLQKMSTYFQPEKTSASGQLNLVMSPVGHLETPPKIVSTSAGIKPLLFLFFLKVLQQVLSFCRSEFLVPILLPQKSVEGLTLFLEWRS